MARVMLGVHGLDTDEAARRVERSLLDLPGLVSAEAGKDGQVYVEYDDRELTVMDLIRQLRRLGFLAGME